MIKPVHLLHRAIGNLFETTLASEFPTYPLIKDEACGGDQRIPLFTSIEKSRKTWYCDVDLLVLKKDKIKIIVEIEESHLGPMQVCGKFLISALTRFYIHGSNNNTPLEMDDSVTFIQIMDCTKLDLEKTSKLTQWENIERSINEILPMINSNITRYGLWYGITSHLNDSERSKKLVDLIRKGCS